MDRGAWWATVHGVAKRQTWLSNWHVHFQAIYSWALLFYPVSQSLPFTEVFISVTFNIIIRITGCRSTIFPPFLLLVFIARQIFSSCGKWDFLQMQYTSFSLWRLLLVQSMTSRTHGLQKLWCAGLAAPSHVGPSQTRDQTRILCIGRRTL